MTPMNPTPTENQRPTLGKTEFYSAFFLCLFLGVFGAHRFYAGKIKSGIVQLITFGGFGIWTFVDLLMILLSKFKDKSGVAIQNINPKLSWSIFAVVVTIFGIASIGANSGKSDSNSGTSAEGKTQTLSSSESKLVGGYLCQSPSAVLQLESDKTATLMISGDASNGHWRLTFDSNMHNAIEFSPNNGLSSKFTVYGDGSLEETKYGYRFERMSPK